MNIQVIGSGAAGNKAVIEAVKNKVIDSNSYMLINSTPKDIQEEYKENAFILSSNAFGCAKERGAARKLTIDAITSNRLDLESWIEPTTDTVVIVASTDGGTGSGSAPVIADYISNQLSVKVRVHIVALNGFDDDVKGLKNTIEFYKELASDYTIEVICNMKFMKGNNNNKLKAEKAANVEFCQRMLVLQGSCIIESENNIDDADLLKTGITPGFMNIEYTEFPERLRNVNEFNDFLNKICDETKSFDVTSPSQKRMAVIVNLNKTTTDAIDWSFKVLKERFGSVRELYSHTQHNNQSEFIAFINAGLNIPEESINEIYASYQLENSKLSKKADSFFGSSNKFELDDDEDEDILYKEPKQTATSKSAFFAEKAASVIAKNEDKFKEKNIKVTTVEENY